MQDKITSQRSICCYLAENKEMGEAGPVGSTYKRYFPSKGAQEKSWKNLQFIMKNKKMRKHKNLGHAP